MKRFFAAALRARAIILLQMDVEDESRKKLEAFATKSSRLRAEVAECRWMVKNYVDEMNRWRDASLIIYNEGFNKAIEQAQFFDPQADFSRVDCLKEIRDGALVDPEPKEEVPKPYEEGLPTAALEPCGRRRPRLADQDRLAAVEADMAAMRDIVMQMAQHMTQMTKYMTDISSIIPGAPAPPPPPSFSARTSASDPSSSSMSTDLLPTQPLSMSPPPQPPDAPNH
ncbi:hypothetical protein Cni_G22432 [Canna indica]|uniref:Uncharacterized protein n=1 Tax=Canna indica TaxID=4628 RepID=A0AAQ3KRU2_9LILI|nr:hypothetical protein Cni_G22432 [Canna indica]